MLENGLENRNFATLDRLWRFPGTTSRPPSAPYRTAFAPSFPPKTSPIARTSGITATEAVEASRAYGKKDRKSTRLNSSHVKISYAVFCLKKKTKTQADSGVNGNRKTVT